METPPHAAPDQTAQPSPAAVAEPAGDLSRSGLFSTDDAALTKLHPNYVHALRISAVLTSIPFLIGALVLERQELLPAWSIITPVGLIALFAIIRVPARRFHARGYNMSLDRLRVVRGILWHSDTVVPFGRVQHIDVNQGPIERFFGISTLSLHTAGSHNATVYLPGLEKELATEMREEIRAHIKRESL